MRTFDVVLALFAVVMSAKLEMLSIIESDPLATHYENPFANGSTPTCRDDELQNAVNGIPGHSCQPYAVSGYCPTDVPAGTTAVPAAVVTYQGKYLGFLQCAGSVSGICAPGAVCFLFTDSGVEGHNLLSSNSNLGDGRTGICMYPEPKK